VWDAFVRINTGNAIGCGYISSSNRSGHCRMAKIMDRLLSRSGLRRLDAVSQAQKPLISCFAAISRLVFLSAMSRPPLGVSNQSGCSSHLGKQTQHRQAVCHYEGTVCLIPDAQHYG
jgi:hypothetical protein